jgi:hypothetical protein
MEILLLLTTMQVIKFVTERFVPVVHVKENLHVYNQGGSKQDTKRS